MRGSSCCKVVATKRIVPLTSRWQVPGQLQHLLPGGRALEPWPTAACLWHVTAEAPALSSNHRRPCRSLPGNWQVVPAPGAAEASGQA